jgi:hypothetical protein
MMPLSKIRIAFRKGGCSRLSGISLANDPDLYTEPT